MVDERSEVSGAWEVVVAPLAGGFEPSASLLRVLEGAGRVTARERVASLGSGAAEGTRFRLELGGDPAPLKDALFAVAQEEGLDLSLQRARPQPPRRLLVLDMDSTLIQVEVIDELARRYGVYEEVAAITERAMRGELDFNQSLFSRVGLLRGLDVSAVDEVVRDLPLGEGAQTLVAAARQAGFPVAVISGGFSAAAQALKRRLGMNYAYSNVLGEEGGVLTGRIVGPVVGAEKKAALLEELARKEGIPLEDVVAVGDGANDLPMIQRAGLGVAFRAKPVLRAGADALITKGGLDAVLTFIGRSTDAPAPQRG